MKLYIIIPTKEEYDSWIVKYDVTCGLIVSAHSPREARKLAAFQRGDEGEQVWLSTKRSTCKELKANKKAGIVMRDFNAG